MLLAGYSYGAMVTTRLPPLDTILSYFTTPAIHTAEADIRMRAQHLAEAQNALSADPASPRKSLGIRVGGDEDGTRKSHDRSLMFEYQREERIRESVRDLLARAKLVYRGYPRWSRDGELGHDEMDHCLEKVEGEHVTFQSAYLAVSPPVGLVTRLATMSFTNLLPSSWHPWMPRFGAVARPGSVTDHELISHPTLVVYGGQDGFISYRKMHEWTRQLSGAEGSQFRHVEVAGAGHFWAENNVIYQREFH